MTTDEPMMLRSRLPDDREYWDELTRRVVAQGHPLLRDYQRRQDAWWSPIARLSPALAATALILLVGYLVAGQGSTARGSVSAFEEAVIPADDLARTFFTSAAGPPAIEMLMGLTPPVEEAP